MKRGRNKSALPRLSRDAEGLVSLAQGLANSGSLYEERFWDARLSAALDHVFEAGSDATLDAALDHLYTTLPGAYDVLIELAEAHADCVELDGHDVLLVAAPILAWSKYAIYSGPLKADAVQTLGAHLYGHIAAEAVRIALSPYLYSIDQLPRSLMATRNLALELARSALSESAARAPARMPETAPLLADTRYLLAAFVVPHGKALFRWQEQGNREQILERWRTQGLPNIQALLPGCVVDTLLPDGYHVACREADRAVRPYSLSAAFAFLTAALDLGSDQLRAVIAPFGKERAEEYRIAFTRRQSDEVVHGVVWPIYGREDGPEGEGPTDHIIDLLRAQGITDSLVLEQLFPLEFCDDCGAPLFADPQGELVHAELPDEAEPPTAHLH